MNQVQAWEYSHLALDLRYHQNEEMIRKKTGSWQKSNLASIIIVNHLNFHHLSLSAKP